MASLRDRVRNMVASESDLDLHKRISRDIKRVREPLEPPKADAVEMDTYLCDLCRAKAVGSGIVQCGLCGRWVCREQCWSAGDHVCESCLGVMNIHRESIRNIRDTLMMAIDSGGNSDG